MAEPKTPATPEVPLEKTPRTGKHAPRTVNPENAGLRDDRDVSGEVTDPNQLASGGPDGAPQPKPREEDPGINANVVS
jgi:hypothetical protein